MINVKTDPDAVVETATRLGFACDTRPRSLRGGHIVDVLIGVVGSLEGQDRYATIQFILREDGSCDAYLKVDGIDGTGRDSSTRVLYEDQSIANLIKREAAKFSQG